MKPVLNYAAWMMGMARFPGRFGRCRRRRRAREGDRQRPRTLADLGEGEEGVLGALELPGDLALRLMELGFLPGSRIVAGKAAPGGDPRVFRVDGSEIALRRETALHLLLEPDA